ncbi:MAG: PTS sugar transporter subunit IIA [Chlamydiia bacterium]|nr:PTS sugar transporter subunit IIA [Chlamydiia bacterium]
MDLKLDEVAELLQVPQETVKQWVDEGRLPGYSFCEEYRFCRNEIDNWMIQAGCYPRDREAAADHSKSGDAYSLYRAAYRGGVLHDIEGETKEEVIRQVLTTVAPKLQLDFEIAYELLLDREALMPTSLNNGIAVPHARENILTGPHNAVVVTFLKSPIPYGALDGNPVHTLFFLFASGDRGHLQLLAKIAHLACQAGMHEFFLSQPNESQFLDSIRNWERGVAPCEAAK